MNDNDHANLELVKTRTKDNVDDVAQEAYNIGWANGFADRSKEEHVNRHDELAEHVNALKAMSVDDLPTLSGVGILDCPLCSRELMDSIGIQLGYDSLMKVGSWTVAQLIAWSDLQRRSGIDAKELLERTSGGVMPGIGGALVGDVGTIGVNDLNGIFVGIEPDGYTHS